MELNETALKRLGLAMVVVLAVLVIAIVGVLINSPASPAASPLAAGASTSPGPSAGVSVAGPGTSRPPIDPSPSPTAPAGQTSQPTAPAAATPRAVPGDDMADPIVIDRLPFTRTVNSKRASAGPWDPSWDCDDTRHAVWFAFRPDQSTSVGVSSEGQDFYPVLWILQPNQAGGLDFLDCDDHPVEQRIRFQADAGETYLIMVAAQPGRGSKGRGGTFVLNVEPVPAPPAISISINPEGIVYEDGRATVSGFINCTRRDDLYVTFHVRQSDENHGRAEAESMLCTRNARAWQIEAASDLLNGGPLVPGAAIATLRAQTCTSDYSFCNWVEATATVTLQPGVLPSPSDLPSP